MSYPGAKSQAGVFHRIIGQMPPHSVYVEPFFGSGQIFHRKRPATESILIDRNLNCVQPFFGKPGVQAICSDVFKLSPSFWTGLPKDAVAYFDPPYLLSTRQGRLYYGEFEMEDRHHCQLLELLLAQKFRVLLSGAPSPLYDSALDDWRCIRYQAMTRGGLKPECLWLNYPEPAELHDWRYAGENFRQRLGLKRLAGRWLRKLERMNERKRGYVLDAISERYFANGQEPTLELALRTAAPETALRYYDGFK